MGLNKKTFRCEKCGECCKPLVKLSKSDVERILTAGYDEIYFIDKTILNEKIIRQINGKCVFLKQGKEKTSCEIYDIRPDICREYPFFGDKIKTCKPAELMKDNKFFNKLYK